MTEQDTRAAPGQWKTLREIADEIGTGKMNVYRYAKTAGLEGVTLPGAGNGQKRFYDVTAQMAIKQHFENKTVTTVTGRPLHEALQCNGEPLQKPDEPLQSNGQTATGCNGSDNQLEELHRLRQEVESLTADRDRLRDQLRQIQADHAGQLERMQGAFVDELTALTDRLNADHRQELDRLREDHRQQLDDLRAQLDQLRQDHREELDRIQAGHAAEVKRLEKQIDDMRAQLDTLAQLTQNAQTLHAAQLQKEERKAIETAATPEEITPQDKPPTLWQRIFGKK
jgi:AcrR family transcriptional regulator